jgi:hypothetical protein
MVKGEGRGSRFRLVLILLEKILGAIGDVGDVGGFSLSIFSISYFSPLSLIQQREKRKKKKSIRENHRHHRHHRPVAVADGFGNPHFSKNQFNVHHRFSPFHFTAYPPAHFTSSRTLRAFSMMLETT